MSPCIIALHVKNSPSDLWELSKNVKLLQDWTKFVGLKGFEADLICSRLKLSKCAIAIPGPKPHIYYSIFCILSTCSTCSLHNKLSLPEIFGTFINAGVRKPKDKFKSKVRKNIFRSGYRDKKYSRLPKIIFTPDIGTINISGYQKYFRLPKIFFSGHKDQNFFRLPKLFFTPDIGSRYCFPTVSAKRPSGSGFMGTR